MALRGQGMPSAREKRVAENEQAVGGMRAPHVSARAVVSGPAFRERVRPVPPEHIRSVPGLSEYLRGLVAGATEPEKGP
eukprot:8638114-Alexandrium_andersonii.AAC.1